MAVPLVALACRSATHEHPTSPSGGQTTFTVGPGAQFSTIQNALNAAPSGSTVVVLQGTYGEHVVVSKSVTIEGRQAVLDGFAGGLNGRFLGFEVRANDVEINGFVVQNFERGIVAENAWRLHLRSNEIRHNTSKDPPPISAGVTKSDGVVLVQCQDADISGNSIHDNGSYGLWLSAGSSGNSVRGNVFRDNGTQQGLPGSGFYGAGIMTSGANNTRNLLADNDISGGYWGIQIGGAPDSANIIQNNRIHGAQRAGISVFGQDNRIDSNDATGNGLANMTPSCGLDLMDWNSRDNEWEANAGTFGVANSSSPRSCP